MRILLVIDGMHPRDGGPPAVVAGSARALQQLGHSVTVLTTVHLGEEDIVKSTWQPMVDAGAEFIFWQQVGALQLLTSGNRSDELFELIKAYDVVHLHSFWSPIAILAARAAYEVGKPYFVSTHGVLDHRAMWRTSFKYFKKRIAVALLNVRAMLRRASGVVFGSEAEATQSWNIEPAMLRLFIPNGVDPDSVDSPVSASDRKRLKQVAPTIEQWDRTLLFLARIHPEKGLDMLVRAFSLISTEFPNAGLLVAGLKQDAQFQTLVENLVAEAPDPDRIAFTTELTGPTCKFPMCCRHMRRVFRLR
jgi:glycosyltransferase involved in cell wall biosynthesis